MYYFSGMVASLISGTFQALFSLLFSSCDNHVIFLNGLLIIMLFFSYTTCAGQLNSFMYWFLRVMIVYDPVGAYN
ncbi:hypothetical protein MSSIT_3715 [Methanosarcina siciliae T4/M]|uniref:Uncharacterized protein n=1 Tax=Methanosarcina siciliae T4/M TaxID=1434120 RepID=A0A0E3PAV7_9EURY|nr:hypothetical protein MSSIT_3715 [Methanosarcina siciliae T4/M]